VRSVARGGMFVNSFQKPVAAKIREHSQWPNFGLKLECYLEYVTMLNCVIQTNSPVCCLIPCWARKSEISGLFEYVKPGAIRGERHRERNDTDKTISDDRA